MLTAALSRTVRIPFPQLAADWRRRPAASIAFVLVFATLACLALVLPGRTVISIYAHDMMIYFDGAHRILSGQLPNRDFHTPLGPLAYLFPAAGLYLTGSLGGTMPVATAIFAAIVAVPLAYVCASRLPLVIAVPVAAYLLLIAIAPINPGERSGHISFAMFYNRFSWVLLSLLFLLYIPTEQNRRGLVFADALVAVVAVAGLFFMKINYFVIAVAFLAGLCFYRPTAKWAAISLLGAAILILCGEIAWRGAWNYIQDIAAAASASSVVRAGAGGLAKAAADTVVPLLGLAAVFVVAALRGVRVADLAAAVFMTLAGLVLLNQNYQESEIVTFIPAALVALLSSPASPDRREVRARTELVGMALVLALVTPHIVNGGRALVSHAARAVTTNQPSAEVELLDKLIVREPVSEGAGWAALVRANRAPSLSHEDLQDIRTLKPRQDLFQTEYVSTVKDGMNLLQGGGAALAGRIVALDAVNPFSVLLRRPPPRGDASWHHYGRTFTEKAFIPAQELFADASVVMVPKLSADHRTFLKLRDVYGPYLDANFAAAGESAFWRAFVRNG